MSDTESVILYARIATEVHEALRVEAERTGLAIAKVAEVVLAKGLGVPHPLAKVVGK